MRAALALYKPAVHSPATTAHSDRDGDSDDEAASEELLEAQLASGAWGIRGARYLLPLVAIVSAVHDPLPTAAIALFVFVVSWVLPLIGLDG